MRVRDMISLAGSGYCGLMVLVMSWAAFGEIIVKFLHGGWWTVSFIVAFVLMFTNNFLDSIFHSKD